MCFTLGRRSGRRLALENPALMRLSHSSPQYCWRAFVLAACLLVLPVRRTKAEDRVDFTLGYYLEDNNRVEVWTPALLWEADLNRSTVLRVQGIYDVVSGASPTGAPMTRKTREVTREVVTTSNSSVVTGYNVVAGPTGTPGTTVPVYGNVASQTKVKETILVPYGKPFLPVQEFYDERLSLNAELEHRFLRDWIITGGAAYGTETDYESAAGTLKLGREFNHKATLVSLAGSFGHDWILDPVTDDWTDREIKEGMLSVAHAINPKTLLTVSGTLGNSQGYLSDQYKYASVDDEIVHEQRPDSRDRRIAHVMLNRTFDSLHGSVEAMYRFYNDSYGIDAHTWGLTWFQHLGRRFILAPSVRYYEQSEADFYDVRFAGAPTFFSSDYRLSKLSTLTMGLKLVWKCSDAFNVSLAYDRYSMQGRDGKTPGEAYPSANIFTVGLKLWY